MLQNLKKLKTKITAINVIAMSIILLIIFVLFYVSYERVLTGQQHAILRNYALKESSIPDEEKEPEIFFGLTPEEPENMMLFYVKTNLSGKILTYAANSMGMRKDFLENLLEEVNKLAYENGDLINEIGEVNFFSEKFAYFISVKPNGKIYAFMDTEYRDKAIREYIFMATGGLAASIICVFFISVYLAGKAIAPIRVSMEKQEKFIADASHELRTPLAVIKSNVEMIIDTPYLTVEENMKWLEYILKESKRMAKMTEDLLFLSKADIKSKHIAKDLESEKTEINLSVLILGVYDLFMKLFEENGLFNNKREIALDISIYANEDKIRQLMNILFDNAIKYTREGGVTVKLEQDTEFAYIKVTDTGQGIPKEMHDKIFERFVRTDKARSRAGGGAGLGLSIAKTIAEEHGGNISVESEVGIGSTFCVKLPLIIL